jgi:hypothetical protein
MRKYQLRIKSVLSPCWLRTCLGRFRPNFGPVKNLSCTKYSSIRFCGKVLNDFHLIAHHVIKGGDCIVLLPVA